jgi:ferric enterobactin receptor
MMGNDDLKAETSINKEIGLEFKRDGWLAGVTWFRNDYRNKIEAGYAPLARPKSAAPKPISISGKTCLKRSLKAWKGR